MKEDKSFDPYNVGVGSFAVMTRAQRLAHLEEQLRRWPGSPTGC